MPLPDANDSNNAFNIVMDFQLYLSDFLRELTGYVRVLKQDTTNPTLFYENYYKPEEYKNLRFLCNLDGGLQATHSLHQFLNKHLMLGNIKMQNVTRKAGEITRQSFGDTIFEPEIYEIQDLDAFANKALNVQDQLEMFFTNIASSGIRDWSKAILTIMQRPGEQPAAPQQEGGNLLKRITSGSQDI